MYKLSLSPLSQSISFVLIVALGLVLSGCTPAENTKFQQEMQKQIEELETRNKDLRKENARLAMEVQDQQETNLVQEEESQKIDEAIDAIKADSSGLGETCGTIIGIQCDTGLMCNNDTEIPDSSGICVMDKNAPVTKKTNTTPIKIEEDLAAQQAADAEAKKLQAELDAIKAENAALKEQASTSTEISKESESTITGITDAELALTDEMMDNAPGDVKPRKTAADITADQELLSLFESSLLEVQWNYPKWWYWNHFAGVEGTQHLIGFAPEAIMNLGEEILYTKINTTGTIGTEYIGDNVEITIQGMDDKYYTFGGDKKFETSLRNMSYTLAPYSAE